MTSIQTRTQSKDQDQKVLDMKMDLHEELKSANNYTNLNGGTIAKTVRSNEFQEEYEKECLESFAIHMIDYLYSRS